jgi:hypothetical protein
MTAGTATITDADVVRAVFGAFASGDLAALSDLPHATRPGTTATTTASAASTAAPMRSSPT